MQVLSTICHRERSAAISHRCRWFEFPKGQPFDGDCHAPCGARNDKYALFAFCTEIREEPFFRALHGFLWDKKHLTIIVIASTFMVRGNPYPVLFHSRTAEGTDRRGRRYASLAMTPLLPTSDHPTKFREEPKKECPQSGCAASRVVLHSRPERTWSTSSFTLFQSLVFGDRGCEYGAPFL